ncbi:HAD family phosphatase [Isosphaeraceae bacterium EP7]
MIRAVIFDFNGVLIDDEHVHFQLFQEVLAQEGVAITDRDYHDKYLGLDDRGCFEAALADAGRAELPAAYVDELIARKARRYFEVAEGGLRVFPGAPEAITALAGAYAMAINSGALRPEIEFSLGRMGVRDRVAYIVSAEDADRCKPDPMGYLLALEGLRREVLPDLAASECLVFEDSLAGIQSALAAGMRAVGVSNTYNDAELRGVGADDVLPGLVDLGPAWVDGRFR